MIEEIFHYGKVAFGTCIVEGKESPFIFPINIDRGITGKGFHLG
jgi:hypothetical protein